MFKKFLKLIVFVFVIFKKNDLRIHHIRIYKKYIILYIVHVNNIHSRTSNIG